MEHNENAAYNSTEQSIEFSDGAEIEYDPASHALIDGTNEWKLSNGDDFVQSAPAFVTGR